MFSLRDPRFVLCSRDLHVLRAQRIIVFLYHNYPQINADGKSDHMDLVAGYIVTKPDQRDFSTVITN